MRQTWKIHVLSSKEHLQEFTEYDLNQNIGMVELFIAKYSHNI